MITYPPLVLLLSLAGIAAGLGAAATFLMAWDRDRAAAYQRTVVAALQADASSARLGTLTYPQARAAALARLAAAEHRTSVWLWWCIGFVATSNLTTWLT